MAPHCGRLHIGYTKQTGVTYARACLRPWHAVCALGTQSAPLARSLRPWHAVCALGMQSAPLACGMRRILARNLRDMLARTVRLRCHL